MRQPRAVCCLIGGIGVFFIAATIPTAVHAQAPKYPTRMIRFIVPFPAGGPVDIPARLIAQRLSETMGQQVVIDNRGGASARIGTELVARAPRDGYTVLFNNSGHTANVAQFKKLPYDSVADFTPVTQVNVTSGNLFVIHPSVPARTVKEFIAIAKARPGELNYASSGVGAPIHVASALFASMAGINLMHVPYKSTVAGLTDVIAGRAEMMVVSPTFALEFIKDKRLRALGITGTRRLPALPDVPTIREGGLADYEFVSWHGMWFPAGVPNDIVRRMHAEVVKALAVPEIAKEFLQNFIFPVGSSPEEFAEFIKKDIPHQVKIMKIIGLEPE
jgi:tripartite-type tricarboxylate transporter receptor subunit TctC